MDEQFNGTYAAKVLIGEANAIGVLTGAGISAESGIDTFRDTDGLWMKWDPEVFASMSGFKEDPELVWGWYADRRAKMLAAAPNAAHLALVKLAEKKEVRIFTQNIDDLHERAGSKHVMHFHGDIKECRCFSDCGWEGHTEDLRYVSEDNIPRCPECTSIARPNVVWFGEELNLLEFQEAQSYLMKSKVVLLIGTSGQVQPVGGLAERAAYCGAKVISINTRGIDHPHYATIKITGPAGEILRKLTA
jgi:NAD-dependent deacetylase